MCIVQLRGCRGVRHEGEAGVEGGALFGSEPAVSDAAGAAGAAGARLSCNGCDAVARALLTSRSMAVAARNNAALPPKHFITSAGPRPARWATARIVARG